MPLLVYSFSFGMSRGKIRSAEVKETERTDGSATVNDVIVEKRRTNGRKKECMLNECVWDEWVLKEWM